VTCFTRPRTARIVNSSGPPLLGRGLDQLPSYNLLGVRVSPLGLHDLLVVLEEAVQAGGPWVVGNHNLHSVYLCQRDQKMRAFYASARCSFIDGMGVVLLGRLLAVPLHAAERMTAVDWLHPVFQHCRARGWRVFLLGGRPGVARRAADILSTEIPGLQLATAHGYFDARPGSADSEAVLASLRAYRPQILIVGMGMPRQEHWILDHLDHIEASAILNQGGFLDYVAGVAVTPPRWMGPLGLEWLGRLVADPFRLWRRYLVEPWALAPAILREYLRRRRSRSGRTWS
jgi:N-acetylglucosaminyldiphosphoundecaprenol N-acetyl-beta-D-mannosaminyltransferase